MAKIVAVDGSTCISCGLCPSEAPEVFEIRDNGYAEVILDTDSEEIDGLKYFLLSEDQYEDVDYSIEGCPTESIKLIEK